MLPKQGHSENLERVWFVAYGLTWPGQMQDQASTLLWAWSNACNWELALQSLAGWLSGNGIEIRFLAA